MMSQPDRGSVCIGTSIMCVNVTNIMYYGLFDVVYVGGYVTCVMLCGMVW